jgi:hypothetical protein
MMLYSFSEIFRIYSKDAEFLVQIEDSFQE